jgi:hypothetical protein
VARCASKAGASALRICRTGARRCRQIGSSVSGSSYLAAMTTDAPDFVTFAREHFGLELHPWQAKLLREWRADRGRCLDVVTMGRRCGRRDALERLAKFRCGFEG